MGGLNGSGPVIPSPEQLAATYATFIADAIEPMLLKLRTDSAERLTIEISRAREILTAHVVATLAEHIARHPVRDGRDGIDAVGRDGRDGKDGKDGVGRDGKDGADGIDGKPGKDGLDGPPGKDGRDGVDGAPGRDGKDGLDAAPGRDGKDGINGIDGKDGEPGAAGKRGDPGQQGERGDPGPIGAPGRDGRDGQEGAPGLFTLARVWVEGVTYHSCELVTYRGGTWQAIEETNQAPPNSSWRLVASGTNGYSAFMDADNPRLVTFAFEASDGSVTSLEAEIPFMLHQGMWLADKTYRMGDTVTWANCSWVSIRATQTSPPSDDWRIIAKAGERGRRGERGPMGPQGASGLDGKDGRTPSVKALRDLVVADLARSSAEWLAQLKRAVDAL